MRLRCVRTFREAQSNLVRRQTQVGRSNTHAAFPNDVKVESERRIAFEQLVRTNYFQGAALFRAIISELEAFGRCCCAHQTLEVRYSAPIHDAHLQGLT